MSINGNQADYYQNQSFNSTQQAGGHSRKKSINNQNVGTLGNISNLNQGQFGSQGSSGNHTAISGGRKPTADSTAYTLYKPNQRGKFSNGGGSISGGQDDDLHDLNNSGFSQNANATASRFYNPNKTTPHNNAMNETQSRFMSNLQQNNRPQKFATNQGNNGIF